MTRAGETDVMDDDETFERELFARRARALSKLDDEVPALADVLRRAAAAEAPRARAMAERGWAQLAGAMAVAAAVLLGAVRSLPFGVAGSGVGPGASRDAGAPSAVSGGAAYTNAGWLSADEGASCSLAQPAVSEAEVCACTGDEPPAAVTVREPLACESEALCSRAP